MEPIERGCDAVYPRTSDTEKNRLMPWFKVDDGFHGHPKVIDLSLEAVGLWTLTGSWCAKYLTDGFVPDKTVARVGGTDDAARELFDAGLWEGCAGGWQFKDWDEYQPLKADVEAEREAARERMKKVRASKKGVPKNSSNGSPEVQANTDGTSGEVRVAPSQSHPSPNPEPEEVSTRKRAHAIRADFAITAEMRSWAAVSTPLVDVDAKLAEFVTYWRGVGKPMKDWDQTWRNGMLKQQGFAERDSARFVNGKPLTRTEQNMTVVAEIAAREAAEQKEIAS